MSIKIKRTENPDTIIKEEYYCDICGDIKDFIRTKEIDRLNSIWKCSECETNASFKKFVVIEPATYLIRYYLIEAPNCHEASEWYETGALEPVFLLNTCKMPTAEHEIREAQIQDLDMISKGGKLE